MRKPSAISELGVQIKEIGKINGPVGRQEELLQVRLEQRVSRTLEVDDLGAMMDRRGTTRVGHSAGRGRRSGRRDEDRELAPRIAPSLGIQAVRRRQSHEKDAT